MVLIENFDEVSKDVRARFSRVYCVVAASTYYNSKLVPEISELQFFGGYQLTTEYVQKMLLIRCIAERGIMSLKQDQSYIEMGLSLKLLERGKQTNFRLVKEASNKIDLKPTTIKHDLELKLI